MIDFETVGDLLRRASIPHKTSIEDLPVIRVASYVEKGQPVFDSRSVLFIFDKAGRLKMLVTEG